MKSIIILRESHAKWVKSYFDDISPYMLKIVNKPLVEYYIDFCTLSGIKDIKFLLDYSDKNIVDYFDDGSKWGINIAYGFIKESDSQENIFNKNRKFMSDDDLLIFDGFYLLDFDKNTDYQSVLNTNDAISVDGNEYIYLKKKTSDLIIPDSEKTVTNTFPNIKPVKSIKEYYELSLDLLSNKSDKYILPGYNNEDKVFLGQNVEMSKTSELTKPVMVGDNVKLSIMSFAGPDSIIGSNVIIDSGTTIKNSIIYDNTYVGCELELEKIILYKTKIIDPINDTVTEINDDYLISAMNKNGLSNFFISTIEYIVASIMFIIDLPLFIICFLPMLITFNLKIKKVNYYTKKTVVKKILFLDVKKNLFTSLFRRLSLDKFLMLFYVLIGKMKLAGNKLLNASGSNHKLIKNLSSYTPGVFSYSDMLTGDDNFVQIDIDENYYSANRGFKLNSKIITKSLLNRLFKNK